LSGWKKRPRHKTQHLHPDIVLSSNMANLQAMKNHAASTDTDVMRSIQTAPHTLQRTCACGEHTAGGESCDECKKKQMMLQRHPPGSAGPAVAPPIVHEVLRSHGEPLDSGTRTAMETHFGHDFSQVRVHSDAAAVASAEAINARAYTVGSHVAFAAGQYQPHTPSGRHLLQHELAHSIQQAGVSVSAAGAPLEIGSASDPLEAEADRMATGGRTASMANGSGHVVRRQTPDAPAATAPATTTPATTPATSGTPAAPTGTAAPAAPATAASSLREWAFGIDLGRMSQYFHGHADAHLDRSPALAARQQGSEAPACELELQLKLKFEFHLGSSLYRMGPMGGMTTPGPPWPAGRADQWKRAYMNMVQAMWHTRWPMEPVNPCPGEPCTRANGHLQIIDVDTMTNAQGDQRRQLGDPTPTAPHVTMQVYEYRPRFGRDESRASETMSTLYAEDVIPQGTPQPQGFDEERYTWRPGAASHETGHMLGRPHVSCPPDSPGDPNRDECYGAVGSSERQNVMGRGQEFSREDQAPFLAAMQAITGCAWRTSGGGLPGWAIALLVLGGVALTAGAIGLGVYLGSQH
jgi:Domain of unknown function (DUF4157)